MKLTRTLAVLGLCLPLAACDEDNAVSARLRLRPDLSGTIVTSGLAQPTGAGAVEERVVGATFEHRVALQGASGRFPSLPGLSLADIGFGAGTPEGGLRWCRVEVPTGEDEQWPGLFVPLSEEERLAAADAFDPSGRARDTGRTLKIEIELPGPVVGNGVVGRVRGTKNTADGATATLIVPIVAAREGTEPLVWHLTW
jgi:hypothetical protein